MAQTPYSDLSSQDILSAHISGLQHDINKIQQVLNMRTATVNGHELIPVIDQEDPSLRYRIYEGTIRNWLNSPEPVILRNGVPIDSSEYEISPAYGVVVFNQQQNANDTVTANFTHIVNQSDTLNSILQRIQALENKEDPITNLFPKHISGYYQSNNITAAWMKNTGTNFDTGREIYLPFIVNETTQYDDIAVNVINPTSTTMVRFGLYDDNGNLYPNNLIVDSGELPANTAGRLSVPIDITLEAGIYWLVSNVNDNMGRLTHIPMDSYMSLGIDPSLSGNNAIGWHRSASTSASFQDPAPSGMSKRFAKLEGVDDAVDLLYNVSVFLKKV